MAFHYPLQKIVDLKKTEKTQAEWMLSHAISKLHDEESRLLRLNIEQQQLFDEYGHVSANRTTISEMKRWQDYIRFMNHEISKKHSDVKCAQEDVTGKQEQLTHRMLDEKVWSKAKERANLKFNQFIQQKEQNELDDISARRRMNLI